MRATPLVLAALSGFTFPAILLTQTSDLRRQPTSTTRS